ncbi:hypothetical protein Q7C36_016266 [Tachysurus vachellii]|uniref:CxC2-like cysteine cluster KDZ transposase-associated domain-containing protein n=1 Tax=Tachysurus vachellii TaxID=175792 RepID=A0AA88M5K1_TACVA|nr:hypothetical protein Q7C36_016266 [Tachysurus vachellii]
MLKVSFECSAPITTQCVVCLEKHADYRCIECSTTAVFCEACLKRTHRNSLHLPDKWNNAYYEPSSLGLFLYLPEGHNTHTVYTKDMKVIVSTGRLCTVTVDMCACEPETCTLLRYGLWPATADKPQTAFSIPLLELFVCLSLECQVSVEGFCNTLRWKNNLTLAEVSQFTEADGDMIVTLDANFGLVRKQSSGTSAVEPLHGTRMFVDEKDVEDYLLSHLDSSKPHEIKYSTRRLDGFGLTDGEGMERLWSFLRRFARVTKEMTPSHRLDLLTDALLHYGRRKSTDLRFIKNVFSEVQLLQRLDKAEKISILAQEDISSVIREAPGEDGKSLIQTSSLLLKMWTARTESRERAVLLHLKRKYPDGQGIAIRLSKQVASSNKRLRQAIKEYNSIQWPPQMSIFPATIDFQEACDPSWHVYFCFDDTIEEDNVSRSLKRRGIDALHMKTRAAEEKRMLYQEMKSVTEHLHQQQPFSALIQRLHQLERKRLQAIVMFHPHVPDIVPADNPHLCQALPMPSIQTLVYNDSDNDDNEDDSEDEYDN